MALGTSKWVLSEVPSEKAVLTIARLVQDQLHRQPTDISDVAQLLTLYMVYYAGPPLVRRLGQAIQRPAGKAVLKGGCPIAERVA